MALIPSVDIFNNMSVESIMNEVAGTGLVVHYFDNVEEAKTWLKS